MKHAALSFIRRLIGINHLAAHFDAIEQQLGPIAQDLAELRNTLETGQDIRGATARKSKRGVGQAVALPERQPRSPGYSETLPDIAIRSVHLRAGLDDPPNLTLATEMAPEPPTRLTEEIAACRKIAPQAIFIMGFARSSTTITSEIINSSPEVLLLGEANWYIPNSHPRFRDWYNARHRQLGTQITKCSYAPDFIPRAEHSWWEWIQLAASFYQLVGDKMAFSSHHFQLAEPRKIQAFFEARFFTSRYIFMIRDPVQTMLSAAQLFSITDNGSMIVEIKAWLRFVQLWADCIRTFPNTLTLIADNLGSDSIATLGQFLDLDLARAEYLLVAEGRHERRIGADFPILSQIEDDLNTIFDVIRQTMSTDCALSLLDQARMPVPNDIRDDPNRLLRRAHHAIGQAWSLAEDLLCRLAGPVGAEGQEETIGRVAGGQVSRSLGKTNA